MLDTNLLEEYINIIYGVQKASVKAQNVQCNTIIFTFSHEYENEYLKEEVTFIELFNFLYNKINKQ